MGNTLRKGQKLKNKMTVKTDNYFAKRREVISIIYDLKKLVDLPRIEVKITDAASTTIGLGWTDDRNTIAIADCLEGVQLFATVLHELVHTVYKVKGHDDTCPLMSSVLKPHPKEVYLTAFLKYAERKTGR